MGDVDASSTQRRDDAVEVDVGTVVVVARGYLKLASSTYTALRRCYPELPKELCEQEFLLYCVYMWWLRIAQTTVQYHGQDGHIREWIDDAKKIIALKYDFCIPEPIYQYLSRMAKHVSNIGVVVYPDAADLDTKTGFPMALDCYLPPQVCHPYPGVFYGNLHDIVFGNPNGSYLERFYCKPSESNCCMTVLGYVGPQFIDDRRRLALMKEYKISRGHLGVPLELIVGCHHTLCKRAGVYEMKRFSTLPLEGSAVLVTPRRSNFPTSSIAERFSSYYVTAPWTCEDTVVTESAIFGMREIIKVEPSTDRYRMYALNDEVTTYISPPYNKLNMFNTIDRFKSSLMDVDFLTEEFVSKFIKN